MRRAASLVFIGLLGCSGAATPDAKTPDAPASSTPASPPPPTDRGGPPKMTLAQHKSDFIAKCSPNGVDYCECAWGQMTSLFSEDDMNTATDKDPRLETFKKNVGPACAAKLSEDKIHSIYVSTCADDPKFGPFCECLWTEQRKKEPASVFVDPAAVKGDAAMVVKRGAAKVCSPKMPEDFQREVFMKSCASEDPLKPFCACAWKSARAALTPGELGAGFLELDMPKLRPGLEKGCGKLRPVAK